jgi:hypothetical protein
MCTYPLMLACNVAVLVLFVTELKLNGWRPLGYIADVLTKLLPAEKFISNLPVFYT